MGINFFKILKDVLDQSMSPSKNDFKKLNKSVEDLRNSYYESVDKVDYSKLEYRLAYIYKYGAAHANLIYYILSRKLEEKTINQMIRKGYLNICSVGGGPGPELLGVMKLIDKKYRNKSPKKQPLHIDFTVIDNIIEWDEHLYVLIKTVEKNIKKRSINISHHFLSLDLNDEEKIKEFRLRFQDMHIFILNHIISELKEPDKFKKCFKTLVERSSPKSYFIVTDINTEEVMKTTQKILNGISELRKTLTDEEKIKLTADEEKTDLGEWFINIKDWPKLTCNVFYMIFQKK